MDRNLDQITLNISQLFNKLFNIYNTEFSLELIADYLNISCELWQNFFKSLSISIKNSEHLNQLREEFIKELSDICSVPLIEQKSKFPYRANDIDNLINVHHIPLKKIYSILRKHGEKFLGSLVGLTQQQKKQLLVYFNNCWDYIINQNLLVTDLELITKTINSFGKNLLHSLECFLKDLIANDGYFNIKNTNLTAFNLGENIATTPGTVVYQNDLLELIKYKSTTKQVYKIPILIIPPCINKYYVLDLTPKNSLVKWLVDQGFIVYMISWVNPGTELAITSFSDYIINGSLKAITAITNIESCTKVHLAGYCIGGTLLSCMLSYMKKHNDHRAISATYFMSLVDFSNLGSIEAFINGSIVNLLEKITTKKGYLDGRLLSMAFNLLRPNDLIWPYIINNYILNKPLQAFDILYWNSDPTNLPAAMYNFYLKNFCLSNKLTTNKLKLANTPINLNDISIPSFFVAGETDHITPWRSVYKGATFYKTKVQFILSSSGHIKGLINPPADQKYSFKTNKTMPQEADLWLKNSQEHQGSWWPNWLNWLTNLDNQKINVSEVEKNRNEPFIRNAPGIYVLKTLRKLAEFNY